MATINEPELAKSQSKYILNYQRHQNNTIIIQSKASTASLEGGASPLIKKEKRTRMEVRFETLKGRFLREDILNQ